MAQEEKDSAINVAGQAFGAIASLSAEGSAVQKASAVAASVINTYQGATSAYAQTIGGPVIKGIAAGVAVAAGLANVKKILSTKTPGGKGGASGGTALPSEVAAPAFDPALALAGAAEGQEQNNVLTLGEQTGSSSANVMRAFVVSDDITSQQEADKKINDLARL